MRLGFLSVALIGQGLSQAEFGGAELGSSVRAVVKASAAPANCRVASNASPT
jgi:hypothetical protein